MFQQFDLKHNYLNMLMSSMYLLNLNHYKYYFSGNDELRRNLLLVLHRIIS